MGYVGQTRYNYFKIFNGASPVTGRSLSDWVVIFTRDDISCSDTLTSNDLGNGRYDVTYTPSSTGTDYLEIVDATYTVDVIFIDTIELNIFGSTGGTGGNIFTDVVYINQDTGGTAQLSVTQDDPTSFTLYVYQSSDWVQGNTNTLYAIGSTAIDANGNWVNAIPVLPDTYHLVIESNNSTIVIAAYLNIS